MKKLFLAVLFPFIAACDYSEPKTMERLVYDYHCEESTVEKRADFILQCIDNANPKSDEEPEDWIRDCQRMAEQTYCPEKAFIVTKTQYRFDGYWYETDRKLKTN